MGKALCISDKEGVKEREVGTEFLYGTHSCGWEVKCDACPSDAL